VSHDRYFVEKLATKIIEVGHGEAIVYPGTYSEFLWSKERGNQAAVAGPQAPGQKKTEKKPAATAPNTSAPPAARSPKPAVTPAAVSQPAVSREQRKQLDADRKKKQRTADTLHRRIAELEARIADRESKVKELEAAIAAPGFYDDPDAAKAVIGQHQALMWEVGDLMGQWEALQEHAAGENDRAPLES